MTASLAVPVLLALVFVAYAGSWSAPFVLDDLPSVVDNPSIRNLWALDQVFFPPAVGPTGGRPLANLSFAVSYALSGSNPWGFHLVNVLFHAAAVLLLRSMTRRLLLLPTLRPVFGASAGLLALLVASVWAVHPLLTQCVTYVAQRTEVMMACCYLLTLLGFLHWAGGGSRKWAVISVLSCWLGVLIKETIATVPLLVLLFDRTLVSGSFLGALRARRGYYLALAGSWLLLGLLLLEVRRRAVGFELGVSPIDYALTQTKAIAIYLGLIVWPSPLVFDRGPGLATSLSEVWPYAILLAVLLGSVALALRRGWIWGLGGAWFLVILAPTSSFVPIIEAPIADNRPYLAMTGLLAVAVISLWRVTSRRVVVGVCSLLVMAELVGTWRRNQDFLDPQRLWQATLAQAPDNYRAHDHLAHLALARPGAEAEALAHFEASLKLRPGHAHGLHNYAMLLARDPARREEAIRQYEAALAMDPTMVETHNNLANSLALVPGREAEALAHYEAALRLKPNYAAVHVNLALLLQRIPGRQADAVAHAETGVRLEPGRRDFELALATSLTATPGRQADAIAQYEKMLRDRPDDADAHINLSILLASIPERRAEAIAHCEAVLRVNPRHLNAHFNLARMLSVMEGRQSDAIAHYEAALALQPDYAAAHNNLGQLLLTQQGREVAARDHLLAAVRLSPSVPIFRYNLGAALLRWPELRAAAVQEFTTALQLDPNFSAAAEALRQLASP